MHMRRHMRRDLHFCGRGCGTKLQENKARNKQPPAKCHTTSEMAMQKEHEKAKLRAIEIGHHFWKSLAHQEGGRGRHLRPPNQISLS